MRKPRLVRADELRKGDIILARDGSELIINFVKVVPSAKIRVGIPSGEICVGIPDGAVWFNPDAAVELARRPWPEGKDERDMLKKAKHPAGVFYNTVLSLEPAESVRQKAQEARDTLDDYLMGLPPDQPKP